MTYRGFWPALAALVLTACAPAALGVLLIHP